MRKDQCISPGIRADSLSREILKRLLRVYIEKISHGGREVRVLLQQATKAAHYKDIAFVPHRRLMRCLRLSSGEVADVSELRMWRINAAVSRLLHAKT